MKTLITAILLFVLTIPVWADSKLSALSSNGSPAGTDLTYDVASGTSYKVTLAQLITLFDTPNVGIGSAYPGQALDVQGTVRAISFQIYGGASTGFLKANGTVDSNTYLTSLTPWTSNINGAGYQLYSTGNVGINSATPGTPLDVLGTIRGSSFTDTGLTSVVPVINSSHQMVAASNLQDLAYCQSNGTNCPASSGTNFWLSTIAVGNVGVSTAVTVGIGTTSGSAGLTVMNGNVGIGTWNPILPLEVIGTVKATAFLIPGGTSTQFLKANGTVDSSTYSTAVGANPSGTVGLSAVNGSSANFIRADGAPALSQAIIPTWTGLHTFNATPTSIITGGNVGIGSTAPGNSLDVLGTVRTNNLVVSTGASPGYVMVGSSIGLGTWMASTTIPGAISSLTTTGSSGAATYSTVSGVLNIPQYSGGTGLNYWLTATGGNLGIGTNVPNGGVGIGTLFGNAGLAVMNGNVGIGTWNPIEQLQIGNSNGWEGADFSGNIYFSSSTNNKLSGSGLNWSSSGTPTISNSGGSSTAGLIIQGGQQSSGNTLLLEDSGSGTYGYIALQAGAKGIRVTISDPNGFVGIGTTAPGQQLDVLGTIRVLGGSGAASTAACWCSDGITLGHATVCASIVASGGCTCANASGTTC